MDVDDESNSDENLEASEKHKSKKGKSEKKDKKDKKVKKEKKDKNSKKNKNKEGAMDTVAPNVEVAVTPVTVPIQTEEEAPKLKKPKKNKSKEVEVIEPVTLTATLKEDTITKSKKSKKNKSQGDQPATMTDSDPATDLEVQANTAVSIYRTNTSKSVIADTDDVSLDKEHKRPKKNKDKKWNAWKDTTRLGWGNSIIVTYWNKNFNFIAIIIS